MPRKNIDDSILLALHHLPRAVPGARSAQRTRSRARAILAKQRERQQETRRSLAAPLIDGVIVLVGVAYLSGAVAQALRLFGGLR